MTIKLDLLSYKSQSQISWIGQNNSFGFKPIQSPDPGIKYLSKLGTAVANGVLAGADLLLADVFVLGPHEGGTAGYAHEIDLQNFIDVMNVPGCAFTKVLEWDITLLSPSMTAADGTTVGTKCTAVSFGGAPSPFPFNLWEDAATDPFYATHKFRIQNGGHISYSDGTLAGIPVDKNHRFIWMQNDDPDDAAVLQIIMVGCSSNS